MYRKALENHKKLVQLVSFGTAGFHVFGTSVNDIEVSGEFVCPSHNMSNRIGYYSSRRGNLFAFVDWYVRSGSITKSKGTSTPEFPSN